MRISDWSSDVCSSDLIRSACPDGVHVIPTRPGALGELLNNAPLLLERLTTLTERLTELLSDRNQASIAGILDNVEDLTKALADRGAEIAATLAQKRIAIQQAGHAAEPTGQLAGKNNVILAKEGRHTMAALRTPVATAHHSLAHMHAATSEV